MHFFCQEQRQTEKNEPDRTDKNTDKLSFFLSQALKFDLL